MNVKNANIKNKINQLKNDLRVKILKTKGGKQKHKNELRNSKN